jgi:DNA-binding GntR family transcriptional regulator
MEVFDPSVISQVVARRTMVHAVADTLREAILSGRIQPGETLRQDDLAEEFGVSRTPVRQALHTLHQEGLVDLEPHRTAKVSDLSPAAIEESFAIRAVLEAEAAKRAVPRLTDEDLSRLRALHDRMSSLERTSDEWATLNAKFHGTVHGACGWPHLIELINLERRRVARYLRLSLRLAGREPDEEHAQILKACERREADLVPILISRHIMRTAECVIEYLNQQTSDSEASALPEI